MRTARAQSYGKIRLMTAMGVHGVASYTAKKFYEPEGDQIVTATAPDKQPFVYARFTAALRAQIKLLITPALIEEHRLKPLGQNSDALERVKNFLSRPPSYALYSKVPMQEWQIIRMPITPGKPAQPIDKTIYRDERTAYHAVFLQHLADLMAPEDHT